MARPSPAPDAPDRDEDAPLDPAIERIRQRLRRLIMMSSLTLILGVLAVLVAVIYRIGNEKSKAVPAEDEIAVAGALPAGAKLVSTALDGNRLALTIEAEGRTRVVIVDIPSGTITGRLALEPQ